MRRPPADGRSLRPYGRHAGGAPFHL